MTDHHVHATSILVLVVAANMSAFAQPATTKPRVLASLERFGCEGQCPVYKLTVFEDGRLEWVGRWFVKQRGTATATLSTSERADLVTAFATAKYFDLAAKYDCADDTPVSHLFYDDGTRKRAVGHDSHCDTNDRTAKLRAEASSLTVLETAIDRITRSERWVGTTAEREALARRRP